jgi:HAD superfamily hydrolase (TIGR01549 family)
MWEVMWTSVDCGSDTRSSPPPTLPGVGRPLDAVIFDMDGTLFDSLDAVTDGFIGTIADAGGPRYTPQQIIDAFPRGWAAPMLTHLLGRPSTESELANYHGVLRARSTEVAAYPGIPEALDALASADLRLGLFTGADVASLDILLGVTGLRERFEAVTGGNEVPRAKPSPDGILLTCRRMGVAPSQTAYVGDSPADMAAAHAAGAMAVAAGWGHLWPSDGPHDPRAADVVAASPLALIELLSSPRRPRR